MAVGTALGWMTGCTAGRETGFVEAEDGTAGVACVVGRIEVGVDTVFFFVAVSVLAESAFWARAGSAARPVAAMTASTLQPNLMKLAIVI
ncbi:hypothetical protein ACLIMP_01940 [Novosphingobium aerophilum]|uniref:hypothetical protein n=1 Tax=Novosphingobium TaxID=165696 RepID=UPI001FB43ACA|nr:MULTISPECIES: hypothetical protein [unclassified Novosphingobium]WRT93059.1 hypothetical protein U9J33_00615 [Novosphingobium sp. RL4]